MSESLCRHPCKAVQVDMLNSVARVLKELHSEGKCIGDRKGFLQSWMLDCWLRFHGQRCHDNSRSRRHR